MERGGWIGHHLGQVTSPHWGLVSSAVKPWVRMVYPCVLPLLGAGSAAGNMRDRIPALMPFIFSQRLDPRGNQGCARQHRGLQGVGRPKEGQGGLPGGGMAQTHQKDERDWPDKWEMTLSQLCLVREGVQGTRGRGLQPPGPGRPR